MAGLAVLQSRSPKSATGQEPNRVWLEQIVRSQRSGKGCLPYQLGLEMQAHAVLIRVHFPELDNPSARSEVDLRQELLELRHDEWSELRDLLLAGRSGRDPGEAWMAAIVAAACLGGDHLWRDLGLASRLDLHELLMHNFPHLAMRNTQDMRWKKFFYKQLCEQDGGYVCRAPSCAQCPTYHDCFGEEI